MFMSDARMSKMSEFVKKTKEKHNMNLLFYPMEIPLETLPPLPPHQLHRQIPPLKQISQTRQLSRSPPVSYNCAIPYWAPSPQPIPLPHRSFRNPQLPPLQRHHCGIHPPLFIYLPTLPSRTPRPTPETQTQC